MSKKKGVGDPWWKGRKFNHPETGNKVKFLSLPPDEQQKLNQWVEENKPEMFEKEVEEKLPPKKKVPKKKVPEKKVKKLPTKYEDWVDEYMKDKKKPAGFKELFQDIYSTNPENAVRLMHFLERLEDL